MNNSFIPIYDESKEQEIIFDFHKSHIWRINSTNTNLLLQTGLEFDQGVANRLDEQKRCRLVYVIDQVPPLTAILRHMENPFQVEWAVMVFIIHKDSTFLEKINPIISYGLGLTKFKEKFVIGVFDYSHRNNLTTVINWQDANMEIKPRDNPVSWF